MAVSRGAVLFLFLLLVAAEMGAIVDAKMGVAKQTMLKDKVKEKEEAEKSKGKEESLCSSQSLLFKGLICIDNEKCAEVCKTESFATGECKQDMAKRKCICKKPC